VVGGGDEIAGRGGEREDMRTGEGVTAANIRARGYLFVAVSATRVWIRYSDLLQCGIALLICYRDLLRYREQYFLIRLQCATFR
jgi:hypothetical protein